MKAKARPKRKARAGAGGTRRLSSFATFRALDHALIQSRKRGLATFLPSDEDTGKRFCTRPTLVIHYDERSPSLSMGQWLQNKAQLRVVLMRDIFHREWNDCMLAVKSSSMWHVLLLTSVVHNLPSGPWEGAAWFSKIAAGEKD